LVDTLFKGKAEVSNDHVIFPIYALHDDSVPQRPHDPDKAKQLLADAGFPTDLGAPLRQPAGDPPAGAAGSRPRRRRAASRSSSPGEPGHVLRRARVPQRTADPPCSGAAELGIVDYGHRDPDVYLNAALSTNGIWNSSQYNSPEFDAAFTVTSRRSASTPRSACKTIERSWSRTRRSSLPYIYNYIAGWSKKYDGIRVSALGQIFLDKAVEV
jgi:hypothetical protein